MALAHITAPAADGIPSLPASIDRTLMRAGESGYAAFNIPAAVATKTKNAILFLEGRKGSKSDFAPIDLLCLRSRDGGKTWGGLETIWSEGQEKDSISIGNPCPVYDVETGRL